MDEATAIFLTDIVAWILVAYWLLIWIGFLTSIVLARVWICHEGTQPSSSTLLNGKSITLSASSNGSPLLPASTFPGVSILKPLTGSDETLSHNLESWFKLRYPIFELLFCVHNLDDPAVPVVNALIDKYPGVDVKLVISGADGGGDLSPRHNNNNGGNMSPTSYKMPLSPTPSLDDVEKQKKSNPRYIHCPVADLSTVINPKIRNLLPAYESAKYDLLFISDCNIEAEPETLHDVVSLMGPRVGTVCQMHFVRDPPSNTMSFGFIVNKVFFGTQNAKCILFLSFIGITTTVSAAMLLRKSALDECGGLRAFGCYLAEDLHIGLALAKRGWTHKLGSRLAWQNPAKVTVGDVFSRIIRWKRMRQTKYPTVAIIDPLSECFVLGLAASWALCHLLPALPFWGIYLAHCLAWFFADFLLLRALNKQPLKFPKVAFLLAWLVRELSAPVVHIVSLTSRRVAWRGQEYYLHFGGVTDRLPQKSPNNNTMTNQADPLLSRRRVSLAFSQAKVPVVNIDHSATVKNLSSPTFRYYTDTNNDNNNINNGSSSPASLSNIIKGQQGSRHKSRRHQHQASSPPSLCAVNA